MLERHQGRPLAANVVRSPAASVGRPLAAARRCRQPAAPRSPRRPSCHMVVATARPLAAIRRIPSRLRALERPTYRGAATGSYLLLVRPLIGRWRTFAATGSYLLLVWPLIGRWRTFAATSRYRRRAVTIRDHKVKNLTQ